MQRETITIWETTNQNNQTSYFKRFNDYSQEKGKSTFKISKSEFEEDFKYYQQSKDLINFDTKEGERRLQYFN